MKFIRWQRSRFIESKVPDPEDVKVRYAAHVAEDFAGMLPVLPERVESIIEVGCGLAAIQVHLKARYPGASLTLLDGDGENITGRGTKFETGTGAYSAALEAYSSRAATEELLGANGVKVDRWLDIGTKELLKADLIVSLASWGYHYPLSTYRARGFVICDLRKRQEPVRGKVIYTGPKYLRCAWREI